MVMVVVEGLHGQTAKATPRYLQEETGETE